MNLKDAQCRKATDEEFKMAYGDSEDEEETYNDEHAEYFVNKFCMDCPIMVACQDDAEYWNEQYGTRGGFTANERLGNRTSR